MGNKPQCNKKFWDGHLLNIISRRNIHGRCMLTIGYSGKFKNGYPVFLLRSRYRNIWKNKYIWRDNYYAYIGNYDSNLPNNIFEYMYSQSWWYYEICDIPDSRDEFNQFYDYLGIGRNYPSGPWGDQLYINYIDEIKIITDMYFKYWNLKSKFSSEFTLTFILCLRRKLPHIPNEMVFEILGYVKIIEMMF